MQQNETLRRGDHADVNGHDPAALPPWSDNLLRRKLVFVKPGDMAKALSPNSAAAARRAIVALGAVLVLAGCSSVAVDETTFFVDPARYDLYDCRQLAEVRKQQSNKVDELERLMAKAQTGTGGAVVSELAYRPDYTSAQANLKLINRVWDENHCDSQVVSTGRRQGPSSLPSTAAGGRVY